MKYKYIKCQLEALEGKFLWHWLIKKNHEIQDTLVILFPSKGIIKKKAAKKCSSIDL